MIAPTALPRKGLWRVNGSIALRPLVPPARGNLRRLKVLTVTRSLAGIIIPPHFRQPTAPLNCNKDTLRWPDPFGPGFLSPQPPGVVGVGSLAEQIIPLLANASWPFSFFSDLLGPLGHRRGTRECELRGAARLPPALDRPLSRAILRWGRRRFFGITRGLP
jgi:hypothetical protein